MELAFSTIELRNICEKQDAAEAVYPPDVVESLRGRLADLRAAESFLDLVAGQPAVSPGPPATLALTLSGGYKLVCEVNHPVPPTDDAGAIHFDRVRRWKVISIESAR